MIANASYVSKRPNVLGGDACVRDTRISVWGIVRYRQLGLSDDGILSAIKGLTRADLEAAFDYAATHADEIEQAIHNNEEGEEGLVE